jgi:hypothetical protein
MLARWANPDHHDWVWDDHGPAGRRGIESSTPNAAEDGIMKPGKLVERCSPGSEALIRWQKALVVGPKLNIPGRLLSLACDLLRTLRRGLKNQQRHIQQSITPRARPLTRQAVLLPAWPTAGTPLPACSHSVVSGMAEFAAWNELNLAYAVLTTIEDSIRHNDPD